MDYPPDCKGDFLPQARIEGFPAIEVRSLVGRLRALQIFYYYNDGEEDLLFGSAD